MIGVRWDHLWKTMLGVQNIWRCWGLMLLRVKALLGWLRELRARIIPVTDIGIYANIFHSRMILAVFNVLSVYFVAFTILWWLWIVYIRLELLFLLAWMRGTHWLWSRILIFIHFSTSEFFKKIWNVFLIYYLNLNFNAEFLFVY